MSNHLTRVATPDDVRDAELLAFFDGLPHYGTRPGRADVDGFDPLSTEGTHRATWRLTGYRVVGTWRDGTRVYVLRLAVNDGGSSTYAALRLTGNGFGTIYREDGDGARAGSRGAADARAAELLAEAIRSAPDARPPAGAPWSAVPRPADEVARAAGRSAARAGAPRSAPEGEDLPGEWLAGWDDATSAAARLAAEQDRARSLSRV